MLDRLSVDVSPRESVMWTPYSRMSGKQDSLLAQHSDHINYIVEDWQSMWVTQKVILN